MGLFDPGIISIIVSFVLAVVLTYVVGFKEEIEVLEEEISGEETFNQEIPNEAETVHKADAVEICSPVAGKVIGDRGVAEAVFPTGHAIGLKCNSGLEVLIHIGIDTVKLEGQGFTVYVEQGKPVRQGDLLVEFDKDLLIEKGYDPTIIFILTDMGNVQDVEKITGQNANYLDPVMIARYREE